MRRARESHRCNIGGLVHIQVDYGHGVGTRYASRYERPYDGDAQSGGLHFVEGQDATSQANADTAALSA